MGLSKFVDRCEPLDDNSSMNGTGQKYYGNVEETIEEVLSDHSDEKDPKSRLSHSSNSTKNRRKFLPFSESQFSFYTHGKSNRRAQSTICILESEAIAEELEEYDHYNPSENEHKPS